MSEQTDIRDSKRQSMGLLDVSQGTQFKHYRECKYKNNPVISLEVLNVREDVKSISTAYFFMNEGNAVKGEEKESHFDSNGRIVKESITKYDIEDKLINKCWEYEGDKLVCLESVSEGNILRVDYLYVEEIYVGKKIRNNGTVNHFINYLYGNDVILEERYGANGKIETRTKKAYNGEGREIESVLSFNFFDNHHRFTYEYDEFGRISKCEKWDCDNKLIDSIVYAYNEQNDIVKTVNSITNLVLDYKYEYDSYNNWIKKETFNGGELQSFWKREIGY